MSVLEEICQAKRDHVAQRKTAAPLASLTRTAPAPLGFAKALTQALIHVLDQATPLGIIAEVKRASPSQGVLREDMDIIALAGAYLAGGATCLSVLTDAPYFHGSDDDLRDLRPLCPVPILRKDFMVDPYQIVESWALGADCVLVILAAVDDDLANDLIAAAKDHQLDALIEVHDEIELDRALALDSPLIGVNNRNLRDLKVDLATGERLLGRIPPSHLAITESGMKTPHDLARMMRAGARAALIGQSLCQAGDPAQALAALRQAVLTGFAVPPDGATP